MFLIKIDAKTGVFNHQAESKEIHKFYLLLVQERLVTFFFICEIFFGF